MSGPHPLGEHHRRRHRLPHRKHMGADQLGHTEASQHISHHGGGAVRETASAHTELTTDDLNRLALGIGGKTPEEVHAALEKAIGQGNAGSPAAPPPEPTIVGYADYQFTQGGNVPHHYKGVLKSDGTFEGKVFEITDKGDVPAHLPKAMTDKMQEYAREDITQARSDHPGEVADIRSSFTHGYVHSHDRLNGISDAYAKSLIALAQTQRQQESAQAFADKIRNALNDYPPAIILDYVQEHRQELQQQLSKHPEVKDVLKQYCTEHPGTELSNTLDEMSKNATIAQAAMTSAPSTRPKPSGPS